MINPKTIIPVFLLFIACRQHTPPKVVELPVKPATEQTYFAKKPAKYYFNYDSSKVNIQNFDSGYVDTFSIAGTRFKLFSNPDSSNDLEMQVLANGQWITNFRTLYGFDGNLHENDVNDDGYADFEQFLHKGSYVFLYDPDAKKMVDTPINISLENGIIDKKANIHYEIWDQNDPEWISTVYQFKGIRQYYLFTLRCISSDTMPNSVDYIRVYKCMNNDPEDTVFIRQVKIDEDYSDFDYKKYWKAFLRANEGKY
jgi:hypothetical protein